MAGNSDPRKRGEDGLLPVQRLVLQELSHRGDWKQACDAAEVSHGTFRRWLREDAAFQTAFDQRFGKQEDSVRKQLSLSAQRASEMYDQALNATKDLDIELKCPHCSGEIKVTAEVPDWQARLKAGEVVLKVGKILKDVKEYSGKVTIEQLDLPARLALAAYRAGKEIPPGIYNQLVSEGFIEQKRLGDGAVEGEFREIDPTDEQ